MSSGRPWNMIQSLIMQISGVDSWSAASVSVKSSVHDGRGKLIGWRWGLEPMRKRGRCSSRATCRRRRYSTNWITNQVVCRQVLAAKGGDALKCCWWVRHINCSPQWRCWPSPIFGLKFRPVALLCGFFWEGKFPLRGKNERGRYRVTWLALNFEGKACVSLMSRVCAVCNYRLEIFKGKIQRGQQRRRGTQSCGLPFNFAARGHWSSNDE